MSDSRLDSVRETLHHELDLADAELGRLKAELEAATKERKAIHDALAALGRKNAKSGAKKPAPKKEQVLLIVASLLDLNGSMPQDDLEGLVKDRLVEDGCNHAGFSLRFAEVLKDDRLRVSSDGSVGLAGTLAATS